MRWIFHNSFILMSILHLIDDFIIKILIAFDLRWEFHLIIDQETNQIKYEVNTPPQVEVENAKISVYVESTHHFNIFFSESDLSIRQEVVISPSYGQSVDNKVKFQRNSWRTCNSYTCRLQDCLTKCLLLYV